MLLSQIGKAPIPILPVRTANPTLGLCLVHPWNGAAFGSFKLSSLLRKQMILLYSFNQCVYLLDSRQSVSLNIAEIYPHVKLFTLKLDPDFDVSTKPVLQYYFETQESCCTTAALSLK